MAPNINSIEIRLHKYCIRYKIDSIVNIRRKSYYVLVSLVNGASFVWQEGHFSNTSRYLIKVKFCTLRLFSVQTRTWLWQVLTLLRQEQVWRWYCSILLLRVGTVVFVLRGVAFLNPNKRNYIHSHLSSFTNELLQHE